MFRVIEVRRPEEFRNKPFVTGCFILDENRAEVMALFSPEIHIPEEFFPSGRGFVAIESSTFFPWPLVDASNGSSAKLNSSFAFAMANYPHFVMFRDKLKFYDTCEYYSEAPPFAEGAINTMTCLKPGSVFTIDIPEVDQDAYRRLLEIIAKQVYTQRLASILKATTNRTGVSLIL